MSIGGATLVGGAHKNLINTSGSQVLDLIDTGRFPATCADFAKKGCTLREAPLPGSDHQPGPNARLDGRAVQGASLRH